LGTPWYEPLNVDVEDLAGIVRNQLSGRHRQQVLNVARIVVAVMISQRIGVDVIETLLV